MDCRVVLASLLFYIHSTSTSTPCCNGENVLIGKRCSDGTKITALPCKQKYIHKGIDNHNTRVDDEANLIIENETIPTDRYCIARLNISGHDHYVVCFEESDVDNDNFTLNAALELISVFFILITILVYLHVPDLLDLQGICILHSIFGLGVSFVVLGINQLQSAAIATGPCLTVAYLIYFSMLYLFFWLNALSFHIWRSIVKVNVFNRVKASLWPYIYHVYGIGGPSVLLILLLIAHHSSFLQPSNIHPGLAEDKCWFKSLTTQFIYFYFPMAVLLCLNILYYAWTIAILWRQISAANMKNVKVLRYRFVLCLKLFLIMGMTWVFELLSAAIGNDGPYTLKIVWFITDCINALQGILIFSVLVVFRKKVIRGLANRTFCGYRLPARWRTAADDECEELEEEFGLSETQVPKSLS